MEELNVLELFSGIGGMHCALEKSSIRGKVVVAIDINENANLTYRENFPLTICLSKSIQKMNFDQYHEVNMILMSPPCSPFTRLGNFNDVDDNRSEAFLYICDVIREERLEKLKFILVENVKGFEKSKMRERFLVALTLAGFHYQEFILSPTLLGIPNTRNRYYCIARKSSKFPFKSDAILTSFPGQNEEAVKIYKVSNFIDASNDNNESYLLSDELLIKRFQVLDIQTGCSENTMCFTRAYTRYVEGTGSVFCDLPHSELQIKLKEIDELKENSLEHKKRLKLRFLSPTEIGLLMSFPENFKFPKSLSDKQKYKLLGNSINVLVVSELIKLMCS